MAWKRVGSFEQLEVIDLTAKGPGTETTGRLVDMREFPSQYGEGKMAKAYVLEQENGVRRQFYGNTVLNNRLPNIQVGNMVKIVFLGTEPSPKKGQNPYKNFDVFEDDGAEGTDESATSETTEAAKKKVPF